MTKKFFLFLLSIFTISSLSVFGKSWEHLPLRNNYFDSENYLLSGEYYDWDFHCLHPFRIKENTVYSLTSLLYSEYFIRNFSIVFYDGSGNEIGSNPPARLKKYLGYGVMEVSFTSPLGAEFLSLDFSVRIESQPPLSSDELYEAFVIYEGADELYFFDYEGPDEQNEVVYENMHAFYRTPVDAPISLSTIKSLLKAKDYIDGDVSEKIEILEDTYSPNMDKLGTYQATFSVSDRSGNRSDFRIYIEIYDDVPPVISGNNHFLTSPGELISESEIKALLTAEDNYDHDVEITAVEDEYTPNYQKLGSYKMVFSARDSSGNESTFPVTVEVKDLVAPLILGPLKLRKSYQETMLVSDILKLYRAVDDIDGDVTETLSVKTDDYTENMYKLGTWNLKLKANDASGNTSYINVAIEVYDGRGPIFLIEKGNLEIQLLEESPDLEVLVYRLQKSGDLPGNRVLKVLNDEYSENKNSPGNYEVVLAGEDDIYNLHLVKSETNEKEGTEGFFRTVLEKIKVFFKNLFS